MPPINSFSRHCIALAIAHSTLGATAQAATIQVTATKGGNCTLHDAIIAANTDTATGLCSAGNGDDIIDIQEQTIVLTSAVAGTNTFGYSGLPLVESTITIEGNNSTVERDGAAPNFRLIATSASSSARLTLNNITLAGGDPGSTGYGGAIMLNNNSTVTLNNATVRNSRAYYGGGIYASPGSVLNVNASTLSRNTALFDSRGSGGGIYANNAQYVSVVDSIISNNQANEQGGGLFASNAATGASRKRTNRAADLKLESMSTSGTVKILTSQISSNTAILNKGGGIGFFRANVIVANTTLTDNSATAKGAAVYANQGSTDLENVTMVNSYGPNSVYVAGDATHLGSVSIVNSVITESTGYDCSTSVMHSELSTSFSWFGDVSCNGVAGANPRLGQLENNGGPTASHLPYADSPLIGAANTKVCLGANVNRQDQRGEPRGDGACTIGAVEFELVESNFFTIPTSNGKHAVINL